MTALSFTLLLGLALIASAEFYGGNYDDVFSSFGQYDYLAPSAPSASAAVHTDYAQYGEAAPLFGGSLYGGSNFKAGAGSSYAYAAAGGPNGARAIAEAPGPNLSPISLTYGKKNAGKASTYASKAAVATSGYPSYVPYPVTYAPTTEAITTEAPTTEAPTTPSTETPTTEAPTTEAPTTPSTETPTTEAPTTPSTETPTTEAPTTEAPTTPSTEAPITPEVTTEEVTTEEVTTEEVTTEEVTTEEVTTEEVTTTETTTGEPDNNFIQIAVNGIIFTAVSFTGCETPNVVVTLTINGVPTTASGCI